MMKTQEEMLEAMGWTVVCESPFEIEHEDGSSASGQSTQIVVDGIIQEYKEMKKEEAIEAEKAKKAEATSSLNLENINGREILEFLNEQIDKNDDLCDISLSTPLEFEEQSVNKETYFLSFTSYFNNWGEDQAIEGNEIQIDKNGVKVLVGEPFEGDGSDEELEKVLSEWIKTHEFAKDSKVKFNEIIYSAFKKLEKMQFEDKKSIDETIEELKNAKTYQK